MAHASSPSGLELTSHIQRSNSFKLKVVQHPANGKAITNTLKGMLIIGLPTIKITDPPSERRTMAIRTTASSRIDQCRTRQFQVALPPQPKLVLLCVVDSG